jgi:hydroxymethylpyrimidine pyrophosphatase-like HAD family hydrolase
VTREQIMAIGDGTNALGMIEWAGFGVAVENACEQAKAIARAIVPSNDDLGVARAIQRYVLARR